MFCVEKIENFNSVKKLLDPSVYINDFHLLKKFSICRNIFALNLSQISCQFQERPQYYYWLVYIGIYTSNPAVFIFAPSSVDFECLVQNYCNYDIKKGSYNSFAPSTQFVLRIDFVSLSINMPFVYVTKLFSLSLTSLLKTE